MTFPEVCIFGMSFTPEINFFYLLVFEERQFMDQDFNERNKLPPRKFIAPVIGFNIDDLGKLILL